MSCIKRRIAPTIVAALTLAALAFPANATAAVAQPATILSVSDATVRLSSAEAAAATAQQRVADIQARIAELSLAIADAESMQPQSLGDGIKLMIKAYVAPFSQTYMRQTQVTLAADERLQSLRTQHAAALADLEAAADVAHARAGTVSSAITALEAARQAETERVTAERLKAAAQRAARAAAYGIFPVDGANTYIDSWGFARSGGRSHKGADIMAKAGTPVVAVKDGSVRVRNNRLGGLCIYLTADDGTEYYYAHLASATRRSGTVKAGEKIGKVGSSGNASASAPHLHFEVHPGAGSPVNPFPYLKKMIL